MIQELWKMTSETPEEIEAAEWHREYLAEREAALAAGEDSFIDLDEFEAELRQSR